MTYNAYTEDTLVQQTTAEYLERQLGWQSVYAYNNEIFVPNPHPQPFSQGERREQRKVLSMTNTTK